jgi:hypothetical protein
MRIAAQDHHLVPRHAELIGDDLRNTSRGPDRGRQP